MAWLGAHSSHLAETVGALASVLSIWVVTGALVYLAAARIISNDYEIEARAMLATSASAVGVNLVYVPCRLCVLAPPCTTPIQTPAFPRILAPLDPQPCPQVTFCPCAPALPTQALPLFVIPSMLTASTSLAPHPAAPPSSNPSALAHAQSAQIPSLALCASQQHCSCPAPAAPPALPRDGTCPTPLYNPRVSVCLPMSPLPELPGHYCLCAGPGRASTTPVLCLAQH